MLAFIAACCSGNVLEVVALDVDARFSKVIAGMSDRQFADFMRWLQDSGELSLEPSQAILAASLREVSEKLG
ncbi:hypothetical protein QWZ10_19825 [Paracoccus cavernae]|uniref:Uncharacterized protein n=1 Tax=Paracoccus cavernae TaxID=1571207 RepID=A0ABT8D9G3_9RHOB|nr:hypothetical protein [Paracoccus cavernae]